MFDEATQKKLDRMRFEQCPYCKRWFMTKGRPPGCRVPLLKDHLSRSHPDEGKASKADA